jgi:hypothetical protein
MKTTILYKRIVLQFIRFQDNINSAIKYVINLGYATMSNDELSSSIQRSLLPPTSWYKQSQESDCKSFNFPNAVYIYIYIYIYICIKISLCILKSAVYIFTITEATFIRSFVTIDNINRNRTAATSGATHSIAESPTF